MLHEIPEEVIERELDRAINKTDFFRAFRMLAKHYGFAGFVILRLSGLAGYQTVAEICVLADLPAEGDERLSAMSIASHQSLLRELADIRKPKVIAEMYPAFAEIIPCERAVVIPAATHTGEKFTLISGDTHKLRDETEMASIIFDFSNALRRFCDSEGIDVETPKFRKREIEVIEWTAEGKTSADIAVILGLSEYTVNEYVASAMKKLDAVNRIHLVTKAIRLGVIT